MIRRGSLISARRSQALQKEAQRRLAELRASLEALAAGEGRAEGRPRAKLGAAGGTGASLLERLE